MIAVVPYHGISGFELRLTFDRENENFGNRLATMKISDVDLVIVAKSALERLAGQGKITEDLRATCACVSQLKVKS